MDMRLPGIILTVTGILAIVVTLMRGANLGMSRTSGLVAGAILFVFGVLLLIYAVAFPQ